MNSRVLLTAAVLALAAFAAAIWLRPGIMLGAYLAVWWFWIGTVMGGLANVWLHNLTGGEWGEAIRTPLLRFSRTVWIAALLFVPVLLGMVHLFPWVAHANEPARWAGELSAPAFKRIWLSPAFFIVRSVVYLAVWSLLAHLSNRAALVRSKPFAAIALIVYGMTSGLAAVDWIMSLMPLWYSSVLGWLINTGQMLGGMAMAVMYIMRPRTWQAASVSRDLGNLLLMYVMLWAYLAFSQFLIIWAENLPHEIIWYVVRRDFPWLAVSWALALFLFFIPLLLLLSRTLKQTPHVLRGIAAGLLFMQFVDTCWLTLPSLSIPTTAHWLWALPLAAATLSALGAALWRSKGRTLHAMAKEWHHA